MDVNYYDTPYNMMIFSLFAGIVLILGVTSVILFIFIIVYIPKVMRNFKKWISSRCKSSYQLFENQDMVEIKN